MPPSRPCVPTSKALCATCELLFFKSKALCANLSNLSRRNGVMMCCLFFVWFVGVPGEGSVFPVCGLALCTHTACVVLCVSVCGFVCLTPFVHCANTQWKHSFRTGNCAADEKGLLQTSLFETSVKSSLSFNKLFSILIIGRYYNQ